jgi:hypothetical protein
MGDVFVGIVHPCKLYNILRIGSPFLYIGPAKSHVSEITARLETGYPAYAANHGDAGLVIEHIMTELTNGPERNRSSVSESANAFSKETLMPQMISLLESRKLMENLSAQSISDSRVFAGRSS